MDLEPSSVLVSGVTLTAALTYVRARITSVSITRRAGGGFEVKVRFK